MSLATGTKLGPYEIVAPLGAGGMGDVYRARDTKLDRDVAIKILPELFAGDPERLTRFAREAKTLAALNHPNIAAIYGIEESGGVNAIVLELVEDETLQEKLRKSEVSSLNSEKSGLPVEEALAIARQIADALETAHEKGVVHRDLKPGNIMITGEIKAPEQNRLNGFGLALSPDSRKLAFTAIGADGISHLWIRNLASNEVTRVAGSEGAQTEAFWSPDSRYLAFPAGGKLKKVDVAGGPPQNLCDDGGRSGGWSPQGAIVFARTGDALYRIPPSGGVPRPVTKLDASRAERFHAHAVFLPDGRHFLYGRVSSNPDYDGLYVGSLDAKPDEQDLHRLLPTHLPPAFLPSPSDPERGRLLYFRGSTLMAQAFDARTFVLSGEPDVVADSIVNNGASALYSVAVDGTLVYRAGEGEQRRLTWFDRRGKLLEHVGEAGSISEIRLSPGNQQVAQVRRAPNEAGDVWLFEFARGVMTRFTTTPTSELDVVWSPDGQRLVFASSRQHLDLFVWPTNGMGGDELLYKSEYDKHATSWSSDGRYLLYWESRPTTRGDLWALPMVGDHTPFRVGPPEFDERWAEFSPDGRWIVYTSDETSASEVYVRPFTPPGVSGATSAGGKAIVSTHGGTFPRWRADGREILYQSRDGKMMAVDVTTSLALRLGPPHPLFDLPIGVTRWGDVSVDGTRFLVPVPIEESGQASINVVLNWQRGLKK